MNIIEDLPVVPLRYLIYNILINMIDADVYNYQHDVLNVEINLLTRIVVTDFPSMEDPYQTSDVLVSYRGIPFTLGFRRLIRLEFELEVYNTRMIFHLASQQEQ